MQRLELGSNLSRVIVGVGTVVFAGLILCLGGCGAEPQIEPAEQPAAAPVGESDSEPPADTGQAVVAEEPAADAAPEAADTGAEVATDAAPEVDTAEPDQAEPADTAASEEPPETKKVSRGRAVVSFAASKGTVTFKHRKHQGRAKCKFCHHKKEKGVTPKPCRACHGKSASPLKNALHSKCKGCHKTKGMPIACNSCHGA